MFSIIHSLFSGERQKGCLAVVDFDPVKICGNDVYGRGCAKGQQVKYCEEHVPSDACIYGGRVRSVTFYNPETDKYMEVQ